MTIKAMRHEKAADQHWRFLIAAYPHYHEPCCHPTSTCGIRNLRQLLLAKIGRSHRQYWLLLARLHLEGLVIRFVNLTGFSGNTYFEPLPVYKIRVEVLCDRRPERVRSMVGYQQLDFEWKNGKLIFFLDKLQDFEGVVAEY